MKNETARNGGGAVARRGFLGIVFGFASLMALPVMPAPATAQVSPVAQKIADHFASIRSMSGDFVQFGPRGEQTEGKFFIERPGKVRLNYAVKSGFRVISDGESVVLENPKMKTMDLYPLSKTPLKLLLSERIDLSGGRVKSVREEDDQTVIQMADKSAFGNAKITLKFDPNSYELKEWTISDAQGKDTTVMIFNVKQDVKIDQSMFTIDYKKNLEVNKKNKNR